MKSARNTLARSSAGLIGVVAACAGMDPDYRAAVESWRGATYDEVVSAWGPPNRIVRAASQENLTWLTEDSAPQAQRSGGGAGGVVFGGPGAGRCERTLIFRNGRAVDEDWHGDHEFCKRFARVRR